MKSAIPLPGNEQILVEARSLDWGVIVEYTGPSVAALLEAGCLTPMMADQLKVPSAGRGRRDEDGDNFTKTKRPLKGFPERLQISRYIREGDARKLPGVAACLDAAKEEETPKYPALEERARSAVSLLGADNYKVRARCVGRKQRRAVWSTVERLILIDWGFVKAQAVMAR
jgi:hypothetical protein